MLLDKILFVLLFFFAGFLATALISFIVILLFIRGRKLKNGAGSLISIGSVVVGGIGGFISSLVAVVLIINDNYQWLEMGSVIRIFLYVMGGFMVVGFIKGLVEKLAGSPKKLRSRKK
ncbi:hypothetical protein BKI52_26245 [marine bacterium AO1-C]|nr:hypothetical protein BKI52_26245 [marine bacterium AO1-C]